MLYSHFLYNSVYEFAVVSQPSAIGPVRLGTRLARYCVRPVQYVILHSISACINQGDVI